MDLDALGVKIAGSGRTIVESSLIRKHEAVKEIIALERIVTKKLSNE